MKRLIFILLLLCFVVAPNFSQAGADLEIEKETYVYANKDTAVLKLDKYRLKNVKEKQACLFFVFGGGFSAGTRDGKGYQPYFDYFVKKGFTVVSIDYRLGMKGQKGLSITNYNPLQKAIGMAVEDLYSATDYVLKQAEAWGIDTSCIIISGSSAGAVTCLQAEYECRNRLPSSQILPPGFRYAGLVSFAGAIFRTDGGLHWDETPCPILLLHGEADKTVPYNKIRFFKVGMYGSKSIVKGLRKHGFSYEFLSYKGADHKVSSFPMRENLEEVELFIDRFVLKKRLMQIDMSIDELDKVKVKPKDSYKDLYKKK